MNVAGAETVEAAEIVVNIFVVDVTVDTPKASVLAYYFVSCRPSAGTKIRRAEVRLWLRKRTLWIYVGTMFPLFVKRTSRYLSQAVLTWRRS